jgi:outer membrane protein OmpA-like peptidoglycan-associated protein
VYALLAIDRISLTLLLSMPAAARSGWQQPGTSNSLTENGKSLAMFNSSRPPQRPGALQIQRGIQAIEQERSHCRSRIAVGVDALFDFNQSNLRPDATETLGALGPMIRNYGTHPLEIDGHTDSIGSLSYNRELNEARSQTVKDWLLMHGLCTGVRRHQRLRQDPPDRTQYEFRWQ